MNSNTLAPSYAELFADEAPDSPAAEAAYHAERARVETAFQPQIQDCPFCDQLWIDGVCGCPPVGEVITPEQVDRFLSATGRLIRLTEESAVLSALRLNFA